MSKKQDITQDPIRIIFEESEQQSAAYDGDRMIGLSMGYIKHWYSGTEYIINEFCVDRHSQGKGIGTAFMKAIEAYLSEKGIHQIFLLTDKDVPAYIFYQHNGFTEQIGTVAFAKRF